MPAHRGSEKPSAQEAQRAQPCLEPSEYSRGAEVGEAAQLTSWRVVAAADWLAGLSRSEVAAADWLAGSLGSHRGPQGKLNLCWKTSSLSVENAGGVRWHPSGSALVQQLDCHRELCSGHPNNRLAAGPVDPQVGICEA